jgi:hypothetical protein
MYDLPLTLKTYIPDGWKTVTVKQGPLARKTDARQDEKGNYILYQLIPNLTPAILQP